ncbi:MAG: hypothetical protein A2675_03360 [Candidatus Yonathbacteria bacterium RIFCSPHIGHO2_01_FULL_51_10]|uniref:Uncharacterized protein n=1 Tax=Candidatus Yonathbacteria bacterium RIFCSPHIGHO2_01_FULL_51_10 TaxID=1802723 RepID=A0A1G2S8N5_9BACT|nr:MAG: hypothetical protein A2675_03360 [Candidatus Yonathbacteria bacterium RIFCSPHIGHO2_01_FULL_51_10]
MKIRNIVGAVIIAIVILVVMAGETTRVTTNETTLGAPSPAATVKPDTGGLPKVYQNGAGGFSLRYPAGYVVDESYHYQGLGPGQDIYGVKFTIPPAIDNMTNLSEDSYMSVELLPQSSTCTANLFLDDPNATPKSVTDNGTEYSVASSIGAAAGNRYEETVYAIPGTNPCIAMRYFVHYGVLENYPEGSVQAFDRQALFDQFDQIRRTLTASP